MCKVPLQPSLLDFLAWQLIRNSEQNEDFWFETFGKQFSYEKANGLAYKVRQKQTSWR